MVRKHPPARLPSSASLDPPPPLLLAMAAVMAFAALVGATGWIAEPGQVLGEAIAGLRAGPAAALVDGGGWYQALSTSPSSEAGPAARLLTIPVELALAGADRLVGRDAAEVFIANLWPPLMLLPFAGGVIVATRRFAGWRVIAAVLAVAAAMPWVVASFAPGRLDHVNVLAVVAAFSAAALVRSDGGPAAGALAGLGAAVFLSVDPVGRTIAYALVAAQVLLFVIDGRRWRDGLRGFALGLAAGVPMVALATIEPSVWLAEACAPTSPAGVAIVIAGGLGLAAIGAMPVPAGPAMGLDRLVRGGLVLGLSSLLLAGVALVAPDCLPGSTPATVDPPPLGDVTGGIGRVKLRPTLP